MINIGNIVTKQANLKANKLAVYDQPNDKRVSFSELNNMVNKIANTLLELGVGKGDRVSILSQNCVEYFALFFACAKTGTILQTLNWRLADQEISKISLMVTRKFLFIRDNFLILLIILKAQKIM